MSKTALSLAACLLISFTLHSQAPDLETSPSYEVKNAINNLDTITAVNKSTINAESNLTQYFDTMDSLDQKTPSNYGYRIQIQSISGPNARENIYEKQSEFISRFPEIRSYALWSSPNWVLRIGDFRSRLEASEIQEMIKPEYPASFILSDIIESQFKPKD